MQTTRLSSPRYTWPHVCLVANRGVLKYAQSIEIYDDVQIFMTFSNLILDTEFGTKSFGNIFYLHNTTTPNTASNKS